MSFFSTKNKFFSSSSPDSLGGGQGQQKKQQGWVSFKVGGKPVMKVMIRAGSRYDGRNYRGCKFLLFRSATGDPAKYAARLYNSLKETIDGTIQRNGIATLVTQINVSNLSPYVRAKFIRETNDTISSAATYAGASYFRGGSG
jgi:hypothetical protein